uniref:Uncharacterized protein n=1 Tax=Arundo donax TaxID=35708 RepID=A0A0A8XMS1_ARUDO
MESTNQECLHLSQKPFVVDILTLWHLAVFLHH